MVTSVVERATSNMLIGPDWAMNLEICDMLNRDPSQSKDVVKGIRRRIKSKNSKVQLLALTLLETVIKNCGDAVHIHVAEKDMLSEMVKIVKKKPDFHVKEKILILIDTWQEAFGGPRARYPQFYAAYQELLRMGAVFPQRSETSAPVFTPPQTQPLTSYQQNLHNPDRQQEAAESSAEADFPTLSSTEIQNARGIMDVLAEMLNAIDPGKKEGLRQEVIVDLVEQCRTYKQRVVHLVNSTSDESVLCQGLALNDDLQRLLAKYEAIASGAPVQSERPKSEPACALVDVNTPLIDTRDGKKLDQGSISNVGASAGTQLLLPAPPETSGQSAVFVMADPKMDLLSGDDFSSPIAEDSFALVPVGQQPSSPISHENTLALVDMFQQTSNSQSTYSAGQTYSSLPQLPQQQNFQFQNTPLRPNGSIPNMNSPRYGQSPAAEGPNPTLNSQIAEQQQIVQQQQQFSSAYGAQSSVSLPPPPWEAQPLENGQFANSQGQQPLQDTPVVVTFSQPSLSGPYTQVSQPAWSGQPAGMYNQSSGHFSAISNQPLPFSQLPVVNPQPFQGGQFMGMTLPQQMPPSQMAYMYPQQMYNNQMAHGYGYGQQQNAQFLDQRMYGLSVKDNGLLKNSSFQVSSASYVPPGKPSKPEDKLFGDLVDIKAFKGNINPSRAGS